LLVTHHIFHNHINFNSIVVDDNNYFIITNFSFSIHFSHTNIREYIKQFIIEYDPSYLEWPIEFHILAYLLTNKLNSLSINNIETVINEHINHHTILNIFGNTIVSSYKDKSIKYFSKYVNKSYDYILSDILQYSYTWDNYALSILYLRILIGIQRSINIKNKFIILFMKLLVHNIHLIPYERHSIENTAIQFDILLDIIETKDYMEIIHLLSC